MRGGLGTLWKTWLALAALPACLAVPDGPTPECAVTSDCDTAHGEICDEGVCWGNPPPGPFAAIVTPPGERTHDLVSRELMFSEIPADGFLPAIQLEQPVIYSGQLLCSECTDKAATIVVTRSASGAFPNGPAFRQVLSTDPRTGQYALVLPSSRPEEPFTITVIPSGRDAAPSSDATIGQLVPPLRTTLAVAEHDPKAGFDLALGASPPTTVFGFLKNSDQMPLGSYRVVALGRWTAGAPLAEVSTVDYTSSTDGRYELRLATGILPGITIVATPFGATPGPTLTTPATTAAVQKDLTAPATGVVVPVRIQVKGKNSNGEVGGITGARVVVGAVIPDGATTITSFSNSGTTDEQGFVTLDLLDGQKLQDEYTISIIPPVGSKVGVLFGEKLSFQQTSMMLPDRMAITGVVRDTVGLPLRDVLVTARPSLRFQWSLENGSQTFLSEVPAANVVTSESGEFVLYVDPLLDEIFGTYDLSFEPAANADVPAWTLFDIQLPRNASQPNLSLADVVLPEAAHVRATITDPSGSPIDGAELRLFSLDGIVGADLCAVVLHPPQGSCPIPALLLGHGAADEGGVARLTLPR